MLSQLFSIDFWFQFTFSWFQLIFNWFQFTVNWLSFDFQFIFNCFQFTFNWFSTDFNWFWIDFDWFSNFTFNWFAHGLPPLEKLFGRCFLKIGFDIIMHAVFWEIRLNSNKWKRKTVTKERIKECLNIFTSEKKKTGHNNNSGPPQQTYYWRSGLLMNCPLQKLFGWYVLMGVLIGNLLCCYFNWIVFLCWKTCWKI